MIDSISSANTNIKTNQPAGTETRGLPNVNPYLTVKTPETKPDIFEHETDDQNQDKKNLTKNQKIGIGIGTGALLATIAFLIYKGRISEAKQLAEHIDFVPAKTLEEAIKFGKKNLGIKSYTGFSENDLAALNWINEGLVNTSNRLKGKLRMPKNIIYTDEQLGENTLAGVISGTVSEEYKKYAGYFYVNKKFFSDPVKYAQNEIMSSIKAKQLEKTADGKIAVNKWLAPESRAAILELIEDFQKNKTFNSSIKLTEALGLLNGAFFNFKANPLNTIKLFLKHPEVKEYLTSHGIPTELEGLKKLSPKELNKIRNNILDYYNNVNILNGINEMISKDKKLAQDLVDKGFIKKPEKIKTITEGDLEKLYDYIKKMTGKEIDAMPIGLVIANVDKISPFRTIYHEMGHLQDMVPRCMTTDKCDYDPSKYPKELKEWVDNPENIRIARMVSEYSAHGPGEFVAEVFKELIEKRRKLPKEVLDLYAKLKGPVVPD